MWKWERWFFGAAGVLVALAAVSSGPLQSLDGEPRWVRPVIAASAILLLLLAVLWAALRLRWRRKVKALNFEACLNCGNPLNGLQDKRDCPQCGEPYDLYTVKLEWQWGLREWP
jgi:hypothetical protein